MKTWKQFPAAPVIGALACSLSVLAFAPSAHANVYATNIKLNGGLINATAFQGSSVNISFILNEAATAGTTINILSGTNIIRTLNFSSGSAGTLQGLNTVSWDGKAGGTNVPLGSYGVSITAAANGYTNWTQISSDANPGNYVWAPRGVAVDVNTNSPFYGRILVGNATTGPNPTTVPGDKLGIVKLNADASFADEGPFSTGGYNFTDDGAGSPDSPWRIRTAPDDRIYVNDWTGQGKIISFDMIMYTNLVVLDANNYSANPFSGTFNLIGHDISGIGTTNPQVWMSDSYWSGGGDGGVWVWNMTNGVADPNDHIGTQVVAAGGDLSLYTFGVAVDANLNVYTCQFRSNPGDPAARAMMFSYSNFVSGGFAPLLTATWTAGGGDDTFRNAYDLALDSPYPTYVAFALQNFNKGVRLLNAADGTFVADVNPGTAYRSCAFDKVGNLYAVSSAISRLQVFSPPGTNQATTLAVASLQVVAAPVQPLILNIAVSGGSVTINFTGSAADAPGAFSLVTASTVSGPYGPAAASMSLVSPGVFRATTTASGAVRFYRIKR